MVVEAEPVRDQLAVLEDLEARGVLLGREVAGLVEQRQVGVDPFVQRTRVLLQINARLSKREQQAQQIVDPLRQQGQQFLGGLANNPYMRDQYTPSQAYQQQMSAGQQQIGQTMDRANWSAGQTGIQAGQFGAGRQQVASGLIGEAGVNAASNLSGQLMGQDMQNQLGQAGIFAQSALGGLSSLQGLYGLGMSPMQAAWTPLGNQAAIYGNPAIIGGGGSSRSSSDTGIVKAIGNLFGGFA